MQVTAIRNVSFGQTPQAQKSDTAKQTPKIFNTQLGKAALSYLIPGAGNAVNGNFGEGFAHLGVASASYLIGLTAFIKYIGAKSDFTHKQLCTKLENAGVKTNSIAYRVSSLISGLLPVTRATWKLKGSAALKVIITGAFLASLGNAGYSAYKAYKGE